MDRFVKMVERQKDTIRQMALQKAAIAIVRPAMEVIIAKGKYVQLLKQFKIHNWNDVIMYHFQFF